MYRADPSWCKSIETMLGFSVRTCLFTVTFDGKLAVLFKNNNCSEKAKQYFELSLHLFLSNLRPTLHPFGDNSCIYKATNIAWCPLRMWLVAWHASTSSSVSVNYQGPKLKLSNYCEYYYLRPKSEENAIAFRNWVKLCVTMQLGIGDAEAPEYFAVSCGEWAEEEEE